MQHGEPLGFDGSPPNILTFFLHERGYFSLAVRQKVQETHETHQGAFTGGDELNFLALVGETCCCGPK